MAQEFHKTEKRLRAQFWAEIAPGIPANDKPAMREAFNDWLDGLERDGQVTEYQASRITLGEKPVSKSKATPAQLRVALENLLADVTSGEMSGRNPWSLDSVKAASETLTGDRFGFSSAMVKESK